MRSSKGLKVCGLSKMFCSIECERKYNAIYSKTCALESCKKEFLKENGVTAHTRWFCCEDHANIDPKTQKLDQMIKEHNENPMPMVEELPEEDRDLK